MKLWLHFGAIVARQLSHARDSESTRLAGKVHLKALVGALKSSSDLGFSVVRIGAQEGDIRGKSVEMQAECFRRLASVDSKQSISTSCRTTIASEASTTTALMAWLCRKPHAKGAT